MKQRSTWVSRSIILSAAGALALAASLIQPGSANAQPAPTQQTPAQQMPTMQLGTQMMMPSETAFFGKLLPSVVSINVVKDVAKPEPAANAAGTTGGTQHSFGTGFVIDPSGVIATNSHVVQDAWQIDVTFADGTRVPAHLLKATRLIDVAIIKIDVDHPLPALHWGDSDALQVGDPVFVIGNALGVGISVSGGLVSGLNRNIMDSPYDDYIQTDAAINHGNSGGPLFNRKGEVVGINTALLSATSGWSGLGFAIPARNAQVIIDRLMNYGWLRPGWVGMKIQEVTPEMARALGMKQADGSIVAAVTPGGPAAEADLRPGDVIMHLGTTTPRDERALLRTVATSPIGEKLTFGLWRDGKEQSLDVPVKEWPRSQWEMLDVPVAMQAPHHHIPPDLGIALEPLNDATRAKYGTAATQSGVVVAGVAPGSDAADHGVSVGDIIVRVQSRVISQPDEVAEALDATRADKREYVLVLVQPKSGDRMGIKWVTLRLADD
jgi:serine protease Do